MPFNWETAKRVDDIQPTNGTEMIPEGTAISASQGLTVAPRTQQEFDPQDNVNFQSYDKSETQPIEQVGEELVEDLTNPYEETPVSDEMVEEDGTVEGTIIETFNNQELNPETGLVFAYLESSLDPKAKARGTSAEGLFQFTNSTWNDMVSRYGKKHGIDKETADKFDPFHSSAMGAEYIKFNSERLKAHGNDINDTNLYLYHFMGPSGGRKFLKGYKANPESPVSSVVSKSAIDRNKDIFKNKDGSIRSVGEVYDYINQKVERARSNVQGILQEKLQSSQDNIG
jgi:hypothetical protein